MQVLMTASKQQSQDGTAEQSGWLFKKKSITMQQHSNMNANFVVGCYECSYISEFSVLLSFFAHICLSIFQFTKVTSRGILQIVLTASLSHIV
jgi:hypothetical protein